MNPVSVSSSLVKSGSNNNDVDNNNSNNDDDERLRTTALNIYANTKTRVLTNMGIMDPG